MARIARLALAYWGAVFALGFVLGTARTLWLAPRLGDLAAVALELPVMLGASAGWAARLLRRQPLPGMGAALTVGGLALTLLLASEAALAATIGAGLAAWMHGLATPPGALGLAGQVGFAAIPALIARRESAV